MDTHIPACMINIGVLVSNYGIYFAQVPGMFIFCSTNHSIFFALRKFRQLWLTADRALLNANIPVTSFLQI